MKICSSRGMGFPLLGGSGDSVSRVISKVTIVISTYKQIKVLITLLTKSHDPPSNPTCNYASHFEFFQLIIRHLGIG